MYAHIGTSSLQFRLVFSKREREIVLLTVEFDGQGSTQPLLGPPYYVRPVYVSTYRYKITPVPVFSKRERER